MSLIRNKQRLIHLYRYLLENTDEDHQVTTNDLVEFLKKEGTGVLCPLLNGTDQSAGFTSTAWLISTFAFPVLSPFSSTSVSSTGARYSSSGIFSRYG